MSFFSDIRSLYWKPRSVYAEAEAGLDGTATDEGGRERGEAEEASATKPFG